MGSVLMAIALAARALRRNITRAALTILGLQIGVAAVMIVTGLSTGARSFIGDRLESIGTNTIIILPVNKAGSQRLTEDDGTAMLREAASVSMVASLVVSRAVVTYGDKQAVTNIAGTTVNYFQLRNWPAARGEFWTPTEEVTKAKVCVLGVHVARQLFPPSENPVGKIIKIGPHPHRVLGVLSTKGQGVGGANQDDRIIMPIGGARLRFYKGAPDQVSIIFASAVSARAAQRASGQIDGILRQRHKLKESREPDFQVFSQARLLQVQGLVFDALTGFLVAVAGVSLLVGGIGIMNIMLVSVTERTREIGIRLAIGATRADVLAQFVVEAAALSLIGGLLGVLVGVAVMSVAGSVLGWPMTVPPLAIVIGIGVSALTGIVFGYAPARRASRLDPIDALRHE